MWSVDVDTTAMVDQAAAAWRQVTAWAPPGSVTSVNKPFSDLAGSHSATRQLSASSSQPH